MRLAKALVDEKGRILLKGGVELTPRYIEVIREAEFDFVYAAPEDEPPVLCDEDLDPFTRARALLALRDLMAPLSELAQARGASSLEAAKQLCASERIFWLTSKHGPMRQVRQAAALILAEVRGQGTFTGLATPPPAGMRAVHHAVDVCVAAAHIGVALGMPADRLSQLVTGSLLHDVGAALTPGGLDEQERVVWHTTLGYELLRNSEDAEILAPHVAYEHHETQTGSGLPRGLVGSNKIERNRALPTAVPTLIGEIGAVANHFHRALLPEGGGMPKPTAAALAELRAAAGAELNRELVGRFVQLVPAYPVATEVRLRGEPFEGLRGTVTSVNHAYLERPRVRVFADSRGAAVAPFMVDLAREEAVGVEPA